MLCQFRKFNKFKKNLREADENDVCYQCDKKGHFMRNCPRNMLTQGNGGVNQVGETDVPDLMTSSDSGTKAYNKFFYQVLIFF